MREVNRQGGFEHWHWAVAHQPGEIRDILVNCAGEKVRAGEQMER